MTKLIGIYAIKNITNNYYYIGSSKDIARRWKQHRKTLNNNTSNSIKLQRAWLVYKEEAFIFEVLQFCEVSQLMDLERYYVDKYKSIELGYNINIPGASNYPKTHKGKKHSQETKEKMSKSAKGKKKPPLTEEHKQKLRLAMLNRTFTEDQKKEIAEKISLSHKTRTYKKATPEQRLARSIRQTGSKRSEETKQKQSEAGKRAWDRRKAKQQ